MLVELNAMKLTGEALLRWFAGILLGSLCEDFERRAQGEGVSVAWTAGKANIAREIQCIAFESS